MSDTAGRADSHGLVPWNRQQGSVYLADQKPPATYTRVRDLLPRLEVPLQTYEPLRATRMANASLVGKVRCGLSCRNNVACAKAVPEAFGLSASSVSRRVIRASARYLQTLRERRLESDIFVVLIIDGKTIAHDTIVIALGITTTGEKKILGFVQTAIENASVGGALFRSLVERHGFRAPAQVRRDLLTTQEAA